MAGRLQYQKRGRDKLACCPRWYEYLSIKLINIKFTSHTFFGIDESLAELVMLLCYNYIGYSVIYYTNFLANLLGN